MEIKIHGVQLLKRTDRCDLIKAQIYLKPPIITTMSSSWKVSLQQATQSGMTTVLGLLKSRKLIFRYTSDRGYLIKLLGEWYEKIDLITRTFFLTQEVARPQNFVMGNDETELEFSVESRSFVNRVNDQVRKKQKRISNVAGDGEEHSMIWDWNQQYSWEIISKTIRIPL